MEDNIEDRKINLVHKKCGIAKSRININSRLEKDLRITGIDAYELLIDFRNEFNVDVSILDFDDYFLPEGTNWFYPPKKYPTKILTIEHLIKAAVKGKLDDSIF
jgi:acyl carrier protein